MCVLSIRLSITSTLAFARRVGIIVWKMTALTAVSLIHTRRDGTHTHTRRPSGIQGIKGDRDGRMEGTGGWGEVEEWSGVEGRDERR